MQMGLGFTQILNNIYDTITKRYKTETTWTYLGEDRKTMAGATQTSTIATNALFAVIFAEAGDIRAGINGDASATSATYIIAGGAAIVHLASATKLAVYGATGSYANIVYYG